MADEQGVDHERIVERYFDLVRELRAGKEPAVEELTSLWDPDGVFEFAGAPPVTGTFKGRVAIQTLYSNRVKVAGMPLRLEAEIPVQEAALGTVDTQVHRTRVVDENRVVAGWTTTIGTKGGQGFQVAGSHAFTFRNGKISSLKVVISPKHEEAPNLRAEALTVNDIGRLALAAWPVVA
jgi:ketosteroid isomerase-like protein